MKQVAAVTALILEIFRVNGRLLAAGDGLVRSLDLDQRALAGPGRNRNRTGSAFGRPDRPRMGLTRQAVQRLANDMERDGLLRFAANPNHQRAKHVVMTPRGEAAYAAAMKRQCAVGTDASHRASRRNRLRRRPLP